MEERGHREEEHVPPSCHRVPALRGDILARRGQAPRAARREQRPAVRLGGCQEPPGQRHRGGDAQRLHRKKKIPVFDLIPFFKGLAGWDGAGGLGELEAPRCFPIHTFLWRLGSAALRQCPEAAELPDLLCAPRASAWRPGRTEHVKAPSAAPPRQCGGRFGAL